MGREGGREGGRGEGDIESERERALLCVCVQVCNTSVCLCLCARARSSPYGRRLGTLRRATAPGECVLDKGGRALRDHDSDYDERCRWATFQGAAAGDAASPQHLLHDVHICSIIVHMIQYNRDIINTVYQLL